MKTRIAKDTSDSIALQIYLQLLQKTRDITAAIPTKKYLYYSDAINTADEWDNALYYKKTQSGNNLGDRMAAAFTEVFTEANSIIIMGSDCPSMSPELIMHAFGLLNKNDVVIGPAQDGGYYLLGMSHMIKELFEDMPWSESSLIQKTIAIIEQLNLKYAIMPTLNDIDTIDDWNEYNESITA